jgi:hypothetical protein
VCETVPLPTKADLRILLEEVEADPITGTFRIGEDEIDTTETYYLNCKESPAKHHIVLLGVGQVAIRNDHLGALQKFVSFCKSQLGQRMKSGLPFLLVLTKEVKALATLVSLSTSQITYRLMSGEEINMNFHLSDVTNRTIAELDLPVDLCTPAGVKVMLADTLFNFITAKTTQAHFNKDKEWGCDYLTFSAGEQIVELPPPEDALGWSFGMLKTNLRTGWFPPQYVA